MSEQTKTNNQIPSSKKSGRKTARLLGTVALVGVVAYFFSGERGKGNRKKTGQTLRRIHGGGKEFLKKTREEVSGKDFYELLDEVAQKYKKVKDVSEDEFKEIKKELKERWEAVDAKRNRKPNKSKDVTKKTVKKRKETTDPSTND